MTTALIILGKCSEAGCDHDALFVHPFGNKCAPHFSDACARMRQPILDAGWEPRTFFATKTAQPPDDPVLTEEVE